MDRNMITVMSGQVVDFFDNDFRELYAISEKLNLYKEFHIDPPAKPVRSTTTVGPKRPSTVLPATTSRFQVSLGDAKGLQEGGELKVPAHKYHNPKYQLAFGGPSPPRLTGSLHNVSTWQGLSPPTPDDLEEKASSERMDKVSPLVPPTPLKQRPTKKISFKNLFKRQESTNKDIGTTPSSPTSKKANGRVNQESSFEDLSSELPPTPKGKIKRLSKLGPKSESLSTLKSNENGELPLGLTATVFVMYNTSCILSLSWFE